MTLRTALLVGVAALAPVVLAAPSAMAEPDNGTGFVAPATPLILTRTVVRELSGGTRIVARRSYRVQFVRDGNGYRIDGQLVATEVDAPPALHALADLERSRPETGLFPILLDARGQIVSERTAADRTNANRAAGLVGGQIAASPLPLADRVAASAFVDAAMRSGGGAAWPADLFNPAPGNRSEVRRIDLPGGAAGEVTVSINAQVDRSSGVMNSLDRTVITRLEGTLRESRESWTLQPLGIDNLRPGM